MSKSSPNGPTPQNQRLPVTLTVVGIGHIPSKKNHHFPLPNGGLAIDKAVKMRMALLENAILSALYSSCQTTGKETDSECLKQLRTLLSGLSDDSVKQIPSSSFEVRRVPPSYEGVEITIEPI